MNLHELITSYGLSASHLARKIGMNKTTFHNKLKGCIKSSKKGEVKVSFTGPESAAVHQALHEIKSGITKYTRSS